jgi:hypothetical protein
MDRRGFTIIDFVFLAVVVVLAVATASLLGPAWDVYHREDCYHNQAALDRVLWDANYERKREIWEVLAAFVVAYPDARPPQMVILYGPKVGARTAEREAAVVDLSAQPMTAGVICPQHGGVRRQPVIDYWFGFGKWRCLHKRRHSE